MQSITHLIKCAAFAALIMSPAAAPAAMFSYYVGVDDLPTIASGTYSGLPNPNFNRLTFLLSHTYEATPASNHYHSKGIYSYTGPNVGAGTTVITSTSNFLPEGVVPPLRLAPGTGIYADTLASVPYVDSSDAGYHFSFLELGSTLSLAGAAAGSPESILFNSSAGRWNSPFDGADIHLELVGLTPGLNVGSLGSLSNGLGNPGDELHLGEGTETFSFNPVLWTDAAAAPGIYEARFRLTDESGAFGDSGDFVFRTQVVPEPSAALLGAVCFSVGLLRRRKR